MALVVVMVKVQFLRGDVCVPMITVVRGGGGCGGGGGGGGVDLFFAW